MSTASCSTAETVGEHLAIDGRCKLRVLAKRARRLAARADLWHTQQANQRQEEIHKRDSSASITSSTSRASSIVTTASFDSQDSQQALATRTSTPIRHSYRNSRPFQDSLPVYRPCNTHQNTSPAAEPAYGKLSQAWRSLERDQPGTVQLSLTRDESSRRKLQATRASSRRKSSETQEDKDVDGGYAWIILATMFAINASTFGSHRVYGLIFERLARCGVQSRAQASLPFTIMGAVENMGGLLTGYLISRSSWRTTVFAGSCLVTGAHLLAAMSSKPLAAVASMGFINGAGLSLVAISSFQINNAYFVKFRSTAFGLSLTGAAFGALSISPLCQYVLDKYDGDTRACYLVLSIILAPNVPLSLLLRPKPPVPASSLATPAAVVAVIATASIEGQKSVSSLGRRIEDKQQETSAADATIWSSIVIVIRRPIFHLIWPMQLLYCWLNFVYSVVIVDFGRDRGLEPTVSSSLVVFWALGQLVGRVALSSLVDNSTRLLALNRLTALNMAIVAFLTSALNRACFQSSTTISGLTFLLSVFITNQFILFNGLVVTYMPINSSAMAVGVSSFIGSFLLLPRASAIGYFRDSTGSYDSMLTVFACVLLLSSLAWLALPDLFERLERRKRSARYLAAVEAFAADSCQREPKKTQTLASFAIK